MNNKPVCYIVGAGEFDGLFRLPEADDMVIAADGGLKHLADIGITPNAAIGDFDSYEGKIPDGAIVLPKEKDDTDMEVSIKHGEALGYAFFLIYGGLGGRLSHTAANIQTLARMALNGSQGWLVSGDTAIRALSGGKVDLRDELSFIYGKIPKVKYVSVMAHSDVVRGVCEKGMKYDLEGASLTNTYPIGVSNELCDGGEISVESGTVIIIVELDND